MIEPSLSSWFKLSEVDRLQIFEETASQKGLSSAVVEKDWWVVHTLAVIFSLDYAQFLIFKGGTSLSKGWNLIQRFSEDIDLA
jgi:predicted nucleotidyltransferase component of viral defense system